MRLELCLAIVQQIYPILILILIRTGRWPHGIVGTIHSAPLLHYGQKAEVTTRRGVGQRGGGGGMPAQYLRHVGT